MTSFCGTRIPLLAEVLALLEGRPEVTLFVEIKRESLAQFSHDLVVSRILEVVRPWRAQCVLISFDLAAIYRARQLGRGPDWLGVAPLRCAQPAQVRGPATRVSVL